MRNFSNRSIKISKEFKRHISDIIRIYIQDPRIRFNITVSKVETSNNLNNVKVFIICFDKGNVLNIKNILLILQKASKFICYILSKRMYLRNIPKILFLHDNSFLKGLKISNLINKIIKKSSI
ncbi:30S ribosome-binding factor RbfA [Buchnera aphidicola]|uniref:30S ribosome-binding factor RbfA n=1 Tax=Buchnera aphidicola TaxID=9 RepID=UPI0031B82070